MSELTERLRKAAYQVRSPRATDVLTLCDEYERLEAEFAEGLSLLKRAVIKVKELDRLEGLLRAWAMETAKKTAALTSRNAHEFSPDYRREARAAKEAVYAEAARLAKEKPSVVGSARPGL